MNYEDLIALRDAGYPQGGTVSMGTDNVVVTEGPNETRPAVPTVAMLIVRSLTFKSLVKDGNDYIVNDTHRGGRPEQALIKLWLAKPPIL